MRHFDLGGGSECCFFKCHVQVVSQISPTLHASAPAASAEKVTETKQVAQNVAEVRKHTGVEAAETLAGRRTDAGVTESVVIGALLPVA